MASAKPETKVGQGQADSVSLEQRDPLLRTKLFVPPARPNGADADIGWGLDLIVATPQIHERMRVVWTFGVFAPGAAFEPRQEKAYLNRIDFNVVF